MKVGIISLLIVCLSFSLTVFVFSPLRQLVGDSRTYVWAATRIQQLHSQLKSNYHDQVCSRCFPEFDAPHGVSEPSELHTLSALNVQVLELAYEESKHIDQYGKAFRYRAKVKDAQGTNIGRWPWDVFLLTP